MTSPAQIDGFTQHSAATNGINLSYRIGGDPAGVPVLLWHGFLGTSFVWRKVAPLLAARGFAVLAPDMRGYGDSDKPAGPDGYDSLNLVEDFRGLVRAAGFGGGRKLLLVAHDMGVDPALLWGGHYPDELAGLVLVEEPVLLPDTLAKLISYSPEGTRLGGLWWWMMALAPGVAERLIASGKERAFLTWFYEHHSADPGAIEPAAVDEYLRSFAAPGGVTGAFGVYRAVPKSAEATARLTQQKVRVPVLALGGERSQGDSMRTMFEAVAERVEGGAVPGCGHFIPEEKPDVFVERIAAFASKAQAP